MAQLKNARVLVVDDETDVLFAFKMLLKPEVKEVVTEKNPDNLPAILGREPFDVIFLDMNFKSALNTGNKGLFWLSQILEKDRNATIILITAYGDVVLAVKSLKIGAFDFIIKPWHNEKLLETLQNALEHRQQKKRGTQAPSSASKASDATAILGKSEAI